ncbi:DsbA family protein [Streptomyces sp. H27-D2]|uniref:DsbA family protein n=1 Tax=Streptomyces sp. H27-D2 TaxID=3046304 RepID=UPI002DBDB7E4|nr:thioredoxin domain-containing protein [Streptomyces sp. H27-D2]MEC4020265.1 thioredoxin domain-containing protein [Streptomyces sp. H27-D2]
MSKKNREGQRSARERLHEQRENEKARERRKRTMAVAAGVVVVLAVAGGVGLLVKQRDSGGGDDNKKKPLATPKGAVGAKKTVIPVGASDAPSTLTVYEDFRCPACAQFESGFRTVIRKLEDEGALRTEYHLATLIDGNMSGSGSLKAANAAACSQQAGKFRDYHDVLYSNQPEEADDKFAGSAHLLDLADKVGGLRTDAFDKCVEDGTYETWVEKSNKEFQDSGNQGTPAVLLNGKNIYNDQSNPLTPAKLKKLVEDANRGKKPGSAPPLAAS